MKDSRKWKLARFLAYFGYRQPIFEMAKGIAASLGKPLLNAGCGYSFVEESDVNLDITPRNVPRFVQGDIQDLSMFEDKRFGAAYASHVLEHVDDPDLASRELQRVADHVFIVTPFPIFPTAWFPLEHKWIFWREKKLARRSERGWWVWCS